MRAGICVAIIGLFLAPEWAAADRIALYSDANGDCNLNLVGDISWQFFVYHESTSGAMQSDFRISFDWGTGGGSVLTFNTPYANGPYTWYSGQTLAYGECKTGTFYVATVVITGFTNEPCEAFAHVLDASIYDCGGTQHNAMGSTLTIDGSASCPCNLPTPTERTNWGAIKSLYR